MKSLEDNPRKKRAFKIFQMSPVEAGAQGISSSLYGIAKEVGASMPTISQWRKEYNEIVARGDKVIINSDEFDPLVYLKERNKDITEGIVKGARAGNAQMAKLAKQLLGELVEESKTEITIGLSADEISRRNLEAERQLREGDYNRGIR